MLTCVKPPQSSPGSKGKRTQTRPGAVLGCPGKLEAQSRWVFKLARSFARSTPREDHEKTTKATTSPRPLGGDRWKPAPRCIFHHFCKCDTSQGVTPRLNFRFDRFFELLGCMFHHFCERYTNLGAPPHQNFCFHHFLIRIWNVDPSPHTHRRYFCTYRFRREMYGFPMVFELGVRLRRLFMTLDGPLHS